MLYSFLNESFGRELIGASAFDSKRKVYNNIISKFPDPKSLSKHLQLMANNETDPNDKQDLINLSSECFKLNKKQYPSFVKKICGNNKIWGIAGLSVGLSSIGGALGYVSGRTHCSYSDNKILNMMANDFNTQRKIDVINKIKNKVNNYEKI